MRPRVNRSVFLLFLIVFFVPYACKAQSDIQTIENSIDTITDARRKTSTYLYISEYYLMDSPDKALGSAMKALDISLLLNDSSLISDAYRLLGISEALLSQCESSDSLFNAGLPFLNSDYDKALFYSDMAAAGTLCGNISTAYAYFNKAKQIFISTNDQSRLATLLINYGVTYARNSHYYEAAKSYFEALDICEQLDDQESIPIIYQNLGEVMALQEQYDKAVGYYNSAKQGFEALNMNRHVAAVYLNLGQIYIELEQWDVAKSYLNKSYILDTTYHYIDYESIALKQLGITYLRNGKIESAEELVSEALRLQKMNDFRRIIPETQLILGQIYFRKKEFSKVSILLREALQRAIDIEDDKLYADLLLLASNVSENQNDYQSALRDFKYSVQLRDSIFNLNKAKSIMNLEVAYQTELKEKQIDQLKFQDTLHQHKIKNKTNQVYLLIVSVILLMVVLVFSFSYFRRKRLIENQQREQKFLKDRFDAEEKARDKIAGELHDDIGGQMVGLILQLQSEGKMSADELNKLRKVYQEIRRLSHNLDMPLFNSLSLQSKLKNYFSELREQLEFRINFIDDVNLTWKSIVESQEIQRNIYRIVQELITNTAKYACATEVEIHLMNSNQTINLIYEDNGVGMDLSANPDKPYFYTIHKRLDIFNGSMTVHSKPGNGFFVNITVPFERLKTSDG